MVKKYFFARALFVAGALLVLFVAACKKENTKPVENQPEPLATLGLYEVDSGIYKRVYIPITQIGTQNVTYFGVFDTGSAGMTIDANGILPASMITSSGIQVTGGDSVVVNGITVTSQQAVISYGNAQGETQEFGNVAYAMVTIGNQNGNISTPRIPIFLYYKVVDLTTGKNEPAHSNDVFGVGPGVSYANNAIASPLSYFASKNGSVSGFKLALFNNSRYSLTGTFVPGLLTVGLVPDDLTSSSGFVLHPLTYNAEGGYSPDINATLSYNGQNVNATVLFDTGTPAVTLISNGAATTNVSTLPDNTTVTLTTVNGFTYTYTTNSAYNITEVTRPSYTNDPRTIFSINFFSDNEFLTDYRDHEIGLKNN